MTERLERIPWNPLPPKVAASHFADFPGWWAIAGGWALDLFIGEQSRHHDDTDIIVLRDDMAQLHDQVPGWELFAADPPGTLRPWPRGETLPSPVHDIWCRPRSRTRWQLQLMLNPSDGDEWVYRRDPAIRRPLTEVVLLRSGTPVLAPEIQLLYKSKAPREKDERDLRTVLPHLDAGQRQWLATVLAGQHPEHPWLTKLPAP